MSDGFGSLDERVAELERKMEVLFRHTGALDEEALARDAAEPSPEVIALAQGGDSMAAVKLYNEQTGADFMTASAVVKRITTV